MKNRIIVPIGVLAVSLLAVSVGQTSARTSVASRIVWSRIVPGHKQQLVIANPDGSDLVKLTHPENHDGDIDANISPDGTKVAFERDFDDNTFSEIHMVDADGQNEHQVDLGCTHPCFVDLTPDWLPDGNRFAFTRVEKPFDAPHHSAHSAVLYTAMGDGSDVQRLSEDGIDGEFEDYRARFSPDGSYLVFTRARNDPFGVAIFRMDVDGSNLRRLTPWGLQADTEDLSPATSGPTKDLVAFETYGHETPPGKSSNVVTVPSTCAPLSECRDEMRYVTDHSSDKVWSFNPTWSPAGDRIAYTLFKLPTRHRKCCVGDIWTSNPHGGDREPVSQAPYFEYRPDWGVAP